MKKGLYLLGILLLPLVVYAEESISEAYYIGLLTTIPITVFLLLPIASLMSKTSQEMFKKTIILFFIRAAILLVVTPFYPDITELEGFLFIFTFILSPISITRINKFPSTPLAINGVVTSGSVLSTGLLETTYPSSMVCPKCGKRTWMKKLLTK